MKPIVLNIIMIILGLYAIIMTIIKKYQKSIEEDKEKVYKGVQEISNAYKKIKDIPILNNETLLILKAYCIKEIEDNSAIYREKDNKLVKKSAKSIDKKVDYINSLISNI